MSLLFHDGERLVPTNWARKDFGCDIYLCCPGPSLKDVDPTVFDRPGVFTAAVNTAYPHIPKPDLWLCMDGAQCYDRDVWNKPFPKVIGSKYMHDSVADRALMQYPNVYTATGTPGGLQEMFTRRAHNAEFLWVGNSFWITLHVLIWMGAKRIHLVGTDFSAEKGDYCHDDVAMTPAAKKHNKDLYEGICTQLGFVRAEAERHGIEIISCTPDSPANEHLDYVPLDEALKASEGRMPVMPEMPTMFGAVAELCQWRPEARENSDGVMVASDASSEWMIPWWWIHYHKHNDLPVVFVDMGMSPELVAFCKARGRVIAYKPPGGMPVMHMMPLAMLKTPFNRTIWLDLDCEVRDCLSSLFPLIANDKIGFHTDPYTPFGAGNPKPLAGGVVAYHWGDPTISEWAEHCLSAKFQNNQDALNTMIQRRMDRVVILPRTFQHLRMEGNDPAASVMHWSGPVGHDYIRSLCGLGTKLPKVSILMPAYNVQDYIGDAIRSCLLQSYQNWELIITDDGSRDDTLKIAQAFAEQDSRIYVGRISHLGYTGAFNKCLELAEGDMIARMDADDVQDSRRIEAEAMTLLQHAGEIDLLSCGGVWANKDGKPQALMDNHGMQEEKYLGNFQNTGPIGASIVAWKKVYDKVGGFSDKYPRCPDADWNIRAIGAKMRWGFVQNPYYLYRQHDGQMTKASKGEQDSQFLQALEDFRASKESKDDELSNGELAGTGGQRREVRAALSRTAGSSA